MNWPFVSRDRYIELRDRLAEYRADARELDDRWAGRYHDLLDRYQALVAETRQDAPVKLDPQDLLASIEAQQLAKPVADAIARRAGLQPGLRGQLERYARDELTAGASPDMVAEAILIGLEG